MKLYQGEPDECCPMMGGKLCRKVCPTCKFQQSFTITERATGAVTVRWDCALAFQTQLMMEANLATQGVGQAVETFRNETVKRSDALMLGSVKLAQHAISGAIRSEHGNGQRLSLPGGTDGREPDDPAAA